MLNLFTLFLERLSRATIIAWKQTKGVFKNKQPGDPFLKTIKIFSSHAGDYVESKMRLDTGCEVHNLITLQVVHRLHMSDNMIIHNESICTCLNGEQLISMGTIVLCWKGKRFRKIFTTVFHVINGDSLPWDVILGAETIHEHGILKFAGFGGASHILPKKTKGLSRIFPSICVSTNGRIAEEKSRATARKREHNEKAAANDAKVDADIRVKEEAAQQTRSNTDGSNPGSSGANRS